MSGGQHEAAAFERQERAVCEAAHALAAALKEADDGHRGCRGWSLSRRSLRDTVNEYLRDAGAPFRLEIGE